MADQFEMLARLWALRQRNLSEVRVGEIYHYTSPAGMQSILFNKSGAIVLWASRYDCLNDASEGKVALPVYREVCNEMYQNGDISEGMYKIYTAVEPRLENLFTFRHKNDYTDTYYSRGDRFVASFSKNPDSLAMWNYYSKGSKYEGFNIGLMAYHVEQSLNSNLYHSPAWFKLVPVIYGKQNQKEMICSSIVELQDVYDIHQEEMPDKEVCEAIQNDLADLLSDWELIFKSDFFQHEEEVRLIIDVARNKNSECPDEHVIPVQYRYSNGYLIPYIELKIDKEALDSVCIGPMQCDEENKWRQKKILDEWLMKFDYLPAGRYSEIPVRY